DQRHVAFMRGADLVIHDAQYTEDEYRQRVGWGHSTIEYAVDVAMEAGARRGAVFHHDPTHDDAALARRGGAANARARAAGSSIEVFAAREGLELTLIGDGGAAPVSDVSALRRRVIAGARVLVVTADETQVMAIEDVLAEDGMVALPVPDMHAALTRGIEHLPDLAIVDADLPGPDGVDLIPAFRHRMNRPNFPILLLADRPDAPSDRAESGATDYLAKPYSPPMPRARVRAWLARTVASFDAHATAPPPTTPTKPHDDRATTQTLLASILASIPLFRKCSPEQLSVLVRNASEQVYPS